MIGTNFSSGCNWLSNSGTEFQSAKLHRPKKPVEFSFQEFQQLVLAVTDDFAAVVPCYAGITLKSPKNPIWARLKPDNQIPDPNAKSLGDFQQIVHRG